MFTIPRYYNLLGLQPTGDLGPLTAYYSKRKQIVWFPKNPPLNPPSPMQSHQRNKLRLIAMSWRALTKEERKNWELASKRARTTLTGYNLFTFWSMTHDRAAIRTIERQAGLTLLAETT